MTMTSDELRSAHAALRTVSADEGYDCTEVDALLTRAAAALDERASGHPAALTPREVQSSMFHTTTLRPAYDQDDVDDLLDRVAAALQH